MSKPQGFNPRWREEHKSAQFGESWRIIPCEKGEFGDYGPYGGLFQMPYWKSQELKEVLFKGTYLESKTYGLKSHKKWSKPR